MFKFIAVRRIEKAKKIEAIRAKIERKKIEIEMKNEEKEKKKKEKEEALERTKENISKYLLPISANIHVERVGKKLKDYEFRGVGSMGLYSGDGISGLKKIVFDVKKDMLDEMEKLGAEVIVDVKPSLGYSNSTKLIYFMGTALIQKEKNLKCLE